jgi:DNA-binding transcriptional LysR family regulator
MDLRQLHYFVTVVEEGAFRRAARRLHLAQPPLSIAIRQLERELGVTLLERSTRGVVPTSAGQEMVGRARDILAQVEAARFAVAGGRGTPRVIRVGLLAGPLCAGELTGPIFQTVRQAMPGHTVVTQELSFNDQLAPLLNGEIDVAIVRPPLAHADVGLVPIAEEPRVLVVGSGHELTQVDELSIDDVMDVPMLALNAPDEWAAFWQMNDLRGRALLCADSAPVDSVNATQMALMTTTAATTIAQSTTRLANSPDIHSIRLNGASPTVVSIAYRRGDSRSDVKRFVDAAAGAAAANIHLLPDGRVPA